VQDDGHLLTLLRYAEANPIRANLVRDARRWQWCSLCLRGRKRSKPGSESNLTLARWPIDEPDDWIDLVHEKLPPKELKRLRESVNRGRPWGDEKWVLATARRFRLTQSLRGVGRPGSATKETKSAE
jgi:putative transposase